MSTKIKIILIALAVIVIAAIVLAIVFRGGDEVEKTTEKTNEQGAVILQQQPVLTPEEVVQLGQENLVRNFTERFGTYSNQADFMNLVDLRGMMTERMKEGIDEFIKLERAKPPQNESYQGFETKAVSLKTVLDEPSAVRYLVSTQRQEFKDSTAEPRVFYQDLEIELTKVGEKWLVDNVQWIEIQ